MPLFCIYANFGEDSHWQNYLPWDWNCTNNWICNAEISIKGGIPQDQQCILVTSSLGTTPNLQELLKFTCTDRRVISIPIEIGSMYSQFGIFLLDDSTRSRVMSMESKHHYNAEQINTEILHEWLIGSGKKPVTWATLVEALHNIGLATLANKVTASIVCQ